MMPGVCSPTNQVALDALAAAHGIESSYLDAHGRVQDMPPQVQEKLLAAIGVNVQSPRAIADELARVQGRLWERTLPASVVVHLDQSPLCVAVVLPAGTQDIGWRVLVECGEPTSGRAVFSALPLLDQLDSGDRRLERRVLSLNSELPPGYHKLFLDHDATQCHLIVSPGQCWLPGARDDGRRLWGVAVQLPLVRSRANWGIGDFSDLATLVGHAASQGIDVIGINPLHAGFADSPEHASPYSPSSRMLLNTIFLDVTAVPGYPACEPARELVGSADFQRQLRECRDSPVVQYAAVMELKYAVLRLLYDQSLKNLDSPEWYDFQRFVQGQQEPLTLGCLFQVLREHFRRASPALGDWRRWPRGYRQPESPAVQSFALEHAEEVQFHLWLQWHAETQLEAVQRAAAAMSVGLYRDLAVGADPTGAEIWANQAVVNRTLHVGAPPDLLSPTGQDWGIAPFSSDVLRQEGYRSFIGLIRANMRHAGALRLDHVMALQRLWCIPEGSPASEGGYLSYELKDLLGIVALESQRNRCLVIGEDLGTVPAGFRERLRKTRILSYRVLHFERAEDGDFVRPESYPHLAIAVTGNHDMPPLRGWLSGRDLELRAQQFRTGNTAEAQEERCREVTLLQQALRESDAIAPLDAGDTDRDGIIIEGIHRFLGSTPCLIAMAQLDDWAGESDPVNLPGTSDEYPNWRRKLSMTLEQLLESPQWQLLRPNVHG